MSISRPRKASDEIDEVVSGSAVDRPVGPQRLVRPQDFFDDEVEWPLGALPERSEIGLRIEQPVDVIDPEPLDLAGGKHREDPGMGVQEDRRKLHPRPAGSLMLKNRR